MLGDKTSTEQKFSYRKGTIMGLTAAEAFMLISFILLLLLGLWRQAAKERLNQAESFSKGLTAEQRDVALEYKDHLDQLNKVIISLNDYKDVIDEASADEVEEALRLRDKVQGYDPHVVEQRVRLLEKSLVEQLAEVAATISDDNLRALKDLATLEKIPNVQDIIEKDEALGEIANELEGYKDTGLSVEEVEHISQAREVSGRTGADVAEAINVQAGDKIEALGGEILDNGNVIFPESVLFDAGSAVIKAQFDNVLQEFCRPWFEILYGVNDSLSRVQIEGHASSDWNDEPPSVAFEKNLDLSQRRAGAVFKRCLAYGGNDEVASWAKSKLAAIGYSSSRPIIVNGEEDRERSRRVVFAIDVRTVEEAVTKNLSAHEI
ncbi:OmpA/MotB family protein [Halomonas stenophila]|uniref:Outer membrane protein OmpA-like peptidoglycan-associated protein n=1 Tax=Halomonas stenophila TaxID=795312 RepID=A0A7W5EV68_9GAMM|nr:OmpA family protein [Halomonas stenophila]MBB3231951.1 outer membrane protein OmpA-like peptidoglycan-associated protein [Halomonas stenophila]